MAKHGKANLPKKICIRCSKPFAWRKKWARDWDQVLYCSERCRRTKSQDSRYGGSYA
ncbi:MAG: DUF2256 domain-containing protein [Gammaproteobacteria bacterium TMED243]|nr:hypothetical protein [Gammaproteobacteria bacterium]RPG30074.1 MAG: DUF2256 domain-containing protein [Gammaproteobacteria bacterium TMED243]